MKKLRPTKTPLPEVYSRSNIHPLSIRFSSSERALLRKQADKHTGGNVSEYVRYAALFFEPKRKDFEK